MKKRFVTLLAVFIPIIATAQKAETLFTIDSIIPSYIYFGTETVINSKKTGDNGNFIKKVLCLNDKTTAIPTDSIIDNVGGKHISYKEFYKGIEVYGTRYTLHYDKEGIVKQANGNFRSIDNIDIIPIIPETEALSIAINSVGKEAFATNNSRGSLVIYTKEDPRLAYKFKICSFFPNSQFTIIIDALSGTLLDKIKTFCSATTSVSTLYSGMQPIETQLDNSLYRLRDYTRGNGIETYDFYSSNVFFSSDNSWDDIQESKRGALDVHWGLEKTYDYYYSKFNRTSYDDNGAIIKAYVGWDIANAFWISPAMFLGIHNDTSWVSLDIIAHEFTHAVTETSSALETRGESGAINEGISDAFAVCIEKEVKPNNGNRIWQMGDDFEVFRYINNPNCKYYQGNGWIDTDDLNDDGGVHTNMGVFNYWFYLLSIGGNATNEQNYYYSITGIGLDKAIQICYYMNQYLFSNSNFYDARICSIMVAEQLNYTNGEIAQIEEAWNAVGVLEPTIVGNSLLCQSDVYSVTRLPTRATVTWTLSGSEASKFNLVQNSPSTNKCTITKKANAVFNSSSFNLTLTAKIYQGVTLIKIKTKTLTCNNGFACTYWQDAHSYYGVNYPAITQTQMVSATNYVYSGGIVYLQSEYFRGKNITPSGTFENFQYVGQNIVKFSLPPYTSNPFYISVESSGCDDAVQLTFYPMSYYNIGSYSATLSVVSEQEYRISLIRNEEEPAEDTVDATRTIAENSETDGKVSWTVEAVNALTGRKVLSIEPEGTDYVLSTVGWESGLYILRVIVGGEVVATQKIHVR